MRVLRPILSAARFEPKEASILLRLIEVKMALGHIKDIVRIPPAKMQIELWIVHGFLLNREYCAFQEAGPLELEDDVALAIRVIVVGYWRETNYTICCVDFGFGDEEEIERHRRVKVISVASDRTQAYLRVRLVALYILTLNVVVRELF